eukprot:16679-Heterococcus_DN1.PRE.1
MAHSSQSCHTVGSSSDAMRGIHEQQCNNVAYQHTTRSTVSAANGLYLATQCCAKVNEGRSYA